MSANWLASKAKVIADICEEFKLALIGVNCVSKLVLKKVGSLNPNRTLTRGRDWP